MKKRREQQRVICANNYYREAKEGKGKEFGTEFNGKAADYCEAKGIYTL
jgi:hypothetical protein